MERMLRAASSWEPEAPEPDRLAERAMERIGRRKTRGSERTPVSRHPTTWWGFGTIGVTAAVLLLVYGKLSPEESQTPLVTASPTPLASSAAPLISAPTPRQDPGAGTQMSPPSGAQPIDSALPANGISAKENTHRTAARPSGRRRRPRYEDRPTVSQKIASATKPQPAEMRAEPKDGMWKTETVSHDDYRVLVPVVLTQQDPEDAGVTTTPAVLEVAYDPHAATQADY